MLKYFSVQNKMADFYITLYVKQFNNEHNKFESMKMMSIMSKVQTTKKIYIFGRNVFLLKLFNVVIKFCAFTLYWHFIIKQLLKNLILFCYFSSCGDGGHFDNFPSSDID